MEDKIKINATYLCTECAVNKSITMMHYIGTNFGLCKECNLKWNDKLND